MDDQMALAYRSGSEKHGIAPGYYNVLIAIEHRKRAALVEAEAPFGDVGALRSKVAEIEAAIEEVRTRIKATRQAKRKKVPVADEDKERLEALIEAAKKARTEEKEAREKIRKDPSLLARREEIQKAANAEIRAARKVCGLPWGTYLLVEEAVKAACKAPPPPDCDKPWQERPGFKWWDGSGRIGVRFQGVDDDEDDPALAELLEAERKARARRDGTTKEARKILKAARRERGLLAGLTVDEAMGGQNNFLRIEAAPPGPRTATKKDGRVVELPAPKPERQAMYKLAHLRIGSEGKGKAPVWLTVPFIMDRPLPEGSRILRVWVLRRKVGLVYRYNLQLTLCVPEMPRPSSNGRAVAIQLDWRVHDTLPTVQAARWEDSDGQTGVVLCPEKTVGELRRVEDLHSIRNKHFDRAREILVAWLADREVPEWLKERTAHLDKWKAPRKLATLTWHWRKRPAAERPAGDNDALATLEAWRRKDRHLLVYEANAREQAQDRRTDFYRNFAVEMAAYETVVIDGRDLRMGAKSPDPEEGVREEYREIHRTQKVAAPGDLRRFAIEAAKKRGRTVVGVSGKGTCGDMLARAAK